MSYPKNKKYTYKSKKEQPIMAEPEPIEEVKQEQAPKKDITKILKTTSRLNLRQDAGMDKKILTVIPKGDEVTHTGYSVGKWYYVKYKDYTGFCLSDWLQ